MFVACLDMEGVLTPEIWIGLAERTGVDALRLTTRDEPDYDVLMRGRLAALAENGLGFADLRAAVASLEPLEGARGFLDWLRGRCQVAVVSDTFYELAGPLVAKLGHPMLLCHHLDIDPDGGVSGYRLRQRHPKRHAVAAFQDLGFGVIAVGDSYNDIAMLGQADAGILFCPPDSVRRDHPGYPVRHDYAGLRDEIESVLARASAPRRLAKTGTEQ